MASLDYCMTIKGQQAANALRTIDAKDASRVTLTFNLRSIFAQRRNRDSRIEA